MNFDTIVVGLQLAVRAGVGASLSFALGQLLDLQYPFYSFLAAVIATDLSPAQSRQLGLRRVIATIVGAVCGASLSMFLPPDAWAIGLSIMATMFLCELLQTRDGAKVAGYICGVIVFFHDDEPWRYAAFRLIETMLGVTVAWLISYVPKLIRIEQPGREM